jgi:hypothetical protein
MSLQFAAFLIVIFLLGVLSGALVWIPYTIREQQRRFEKQMELARRVREMTK